MRDLNEVLDLTLDLPIGGKTYKVQPPSAATGADLMNKLTLGVAADAGVDLGEFRGQITVADEDLPDFARQCLGKAYDEMVADDLPHPSIEFCVTTAFLAWTVGKAFAELWWESGGDLGKAAGPNRAARRARPSTATPTRSGAASTTPSRKRRSGTRTSSTSATKDAKG